MTATAKLFPAPGPRLPIEDVKWRQYIWTLGTAVRNLQDGIGPSPSGSVAPVPNTLVLRDAAARSQIADPVVSADIVNLGTMTSAIAAAIAATSTVSAVAGTTIAAGQPVYVDGLGKMQLATASGLPPSYFVGLAASATAVTFVCNASTTALTLSDWSAATGSVTLTRGALYYLSTSTGLLTLTAPTAVGSTSTLVGTAVSQTTMEINRALPVLL